jgi:hypothetical protein
MKRKQMHPAKRLLVDFIKQRLPPFLRADGGAMMKHRAQDHIHREFRKLHGWPEALDEIELLTRNIGRERWTNAWGHALRELTLEGSTEPCAETEHYALKNRG